MDPEHQGHPSTSIRPAVIFKNVGLLHVAGLSNPIFHNERLFAFAIPFLWPDFLAALRKLVSGRSFPDRFYGQAKDVVLLNVEFNTRYEELLREMGSRDGAVWRGCCWQMCLISCEREIGIVCKTTLLVVNKVQQVHLAEHFLNRN